MNHVINFLTMNRVDNVIIVYCVNNIITMNCVDIMTINYEVNVVEKILVKLLLLYLMEPIVGYTA